MYHRTKHTCVMVITERTIIKTILHECNESKCSGHLSEERKIEKVKNCAWWPKWKADVTEYCTTCDRCQRAKKSKGKSVGLMMKIEEPKLPWEVVNMDLVTGLPAGGQCSNNASLVIFDDYSRTPIFLPSHKGDISMDTVLLLWTKVTHWKGIWKVIIS